MCDALQSKGRSNIYPQVMASLARVGLWVFMGNGVQWALLFMDVYKTSFLL